MKKSIRSDIVLWIVIFLPLVYLAYLWSGLPDSVPVHWNFQGEVDRYGSKAELLILTFLPLIMYFLFTIIPKIDPKNRLKNMGGKYSGLRSVMIVFMSALAIMMIYTAKHEIFPGNNLMFILMGGLFTMLGNYFKTLKANYFIGIKTPWTLESETVWNDTHKLGGKLWFAGGFLIILSGIFTPPEVNSVVFGVILAIMVLVPVVYSYFRFEKLKKDKKETGINS
jgi:uncharacterized membrane protein